MQAKKLFPILLILLILYSVIICFITKIVLEKKYEKEANDKYLIGIFTGQKRGYHIGLEEGVHNVNNIFEICKKHPDVSLDIIKFSLQAKMETPIVTEDMIGFDENGKYKIKK